MFVLLLGAAPALVPRRSGAAAPHRGAAPPPAAALLGAHRLHAALERYKVHNRQVSKGCSVMNLPARSSAAGETSPCAVAYEQSRASYVCKASNVQVWCRQLVAPDAAPKQHQHLMPQERALVHT